MSSTIPFHPSLVLGNIVSGQKLEALKAISDLQAPVDSALEEMNSKLSLKLALDASMQEMVSLGIDTADIADEMEQVKSDILDTTKKYIKIRIDNEKKIFEAKSHIGGIIDSQIESPVDYNRTFIKDDMPLSFDSINMDARYFSFDESGQGADSSMRSLKSFISASTKFLGTDRSAELANSAQSQVASQREHHDIKGTLVITATCTHKNALLLAPFILDVDKGIRAWNRIYDDQKIKMDDPATVVEIARQEGTNNERTLDIISGATCGSSFIGMVHVLRLSSTESEQSLISAAESMQAQMKVGGWFASASGGVGVDGSFANDVKSLLSQQDINSHVSLVTMGMIPDIKANSIKMAVKEFMDYDPAKMMSQLAALQNATASDKDTVSSQARKASSGETLEQMHSTQVKSVISGLAEVDDGQNKMIDINSLMDAFSDYVAKINSGKIGVPINYYIKPITRAQLAQMWVSKYYPEKYLAISGDDSAPSSKGAKKEKAEDKSE